MAEMIQDMTKMDLEIALWDALIEKVYGEIRWSRNAARMETCREFTEAYKREQGSAGERIRKWIEGDCLLPEEVKIPSKHNAMKYDR